MSGICGLFNLDHSPVAESDVRAMSSMLAQRGPDRTNHWQLESIGLAHTLLATTTELQFERQPFTHAETGCVITSDVRLDNRDDLIKSLVPGRRPETIGDAELILLAYLAWDEACLDRLLGDFAFAIWNPRKRKLFCGRDHFGMRPLYYHHAPGKRFVFASSARAILVLPQVPYKLNEGRIADVLVSQLQWIDYTSSFFEEVYRLPPGHKAVVSHTGLRITEYWKPSPGPDPGPMSDDDYRECFLEIFTRAVDARLRAPAGTVGSMLSGGMDSGSVVAVAKNLLSHRGEGPLPTYSAVSGQYETSAPIGCAESSAIYATIPSPLIRPSLIYPGSSEQDSKLMLSSYDEPFDTSYMFLRLLYRTASDQGVRTILDGGGGDVVLNEGSYIARLIQRGKLKSALAEIIAENRHFRGRAWSPSLIRYPAHVILPRTVKNFLRDIRNRNREKVFLDESLISEDFANRINLASRFERMRQTFPHAREPDFAVETVNI
ncbi:MAG: asparagine synthase-related protein, partial [Woeseiaceae bacterium]